MKPQSKLTPKQTASSPKVATRGKRLKPRSHKRLLKFRKTNSTCCDSVSHESRTEASYNAHLLATFDQLKRIMLLPPADPQLLLQKRKRLTCPPGFAKTLVFDLEGTLLCTAAGSFKLRPYVYECLQFAHKHFELVVFSDWPADVTAQAVSALGSSQSLIAHTLARDQCIEWKEDLIKDLRVLADRPLNNTIIVDDSVFSFAYQLANGIPILPWTGDPADDELLRLIDYLETLALAADVRVVNTATFNLEHVYSEYIQEVYAT